MPTKAISENKIITAKISLAGKLRNSVNVITTKVVIKKIGKIIFNKKVCFDES